MEADGKETAELTDHWSSLPPRDIEATAPVPADVGTPLYDELVAARRAPEPEFDWFGEPRRTGAAGADAG